MGGVSGAIRNSVTQLHADAQCCDTQRDAVGFAIAIAVVHSHDYANFKPNQYCDAHCLAKPITNTNTEPNIEPNTFAECTCPPQCSDGVGGERTLLCQSPNSDSYLLGGNRSRFEWV